MGVPIGFSERVKRSDKPPISYLMAQAVGNPDILSLAAGLVDRETLPVEEVRAAVDALLSTPETAQDALQYGSTEGDRYLRELLALHVDRMDGVGEGKPRLDADRVLVGTGSQQLLYLVGEVLLDPGDIVLLGTPAYFVFMGVLESLGATIVPVATDEDGLVPEAVDEALRRTERAGRLDRVKLIYDVSYFNNPTGLSLAPHRRPELVALARHWSKRSRIFVLEDAAYRELRYRGADVPSMLRDDPEGEHVFYAGTFSKPFSPGLKTGYLVLPQGVREALVNQKGHHDFGSANFNQRLLALTIARGDYDRHLRRLRDQYRGKLDVMLQCLETEFAECRDQVTWTNPEGGLYVWVRLPPEISTAQGSEFFERCLSVGVLTVPGRFCFPRASEAVPDYYLRLSFGVQSVDGIREGVRRLASVVVETLDRRRRTRECGKKRTGSSD